MNTKMSLFGPKMAEKHELKDTYFPQKGKKLKFDRWFQEKEDRNLGSLVAPTRPRRQPRTPRGDGGGRPCQSNRDQIHAWLVTTDKVRSPWDGRYHRIYKVLTCTTLNLIYYLICDMRHEAEASVSTGHLFTEASFKTFPC